MNRNIGLGIFVLFVCFLFVALAACLSDQGEVISTAVGASTASTSYCTYEDGTWTCGDPGDGGGGGGGGGAGACPGGFPPRCVQCDNNDACVAACFGGFTC